MKKFNSKSIKKINFSFESSIKVEAVISKKSHDKNLAPRKHFASSTEKKIISQNFHHHLIFLIASRSTKIISHFYWKLTTLVADYFTTPINSIRRENIWRLSTRKRILIKFLLASRDCGREWLQLVSPRAAHGDNCDLLWIWAEFRFALGNLRIFSSHSACE